MKQYFANNSYIEHRTLGMTGADSLEGKPYGLITYDEGGRSRHLQQEVNSTFLARLFDWGGELHITSTPDQESQSLLFHYELYEKGLNRVPGYYTLEGELKDNIFFSKKQIQEQYDLFENNPLRDQVIYGKFVFGGDKLFNAKDISEIKDDSLNDGVRAEVGHKYVISTDSAIGADEMVHTALDVTNPASEATPFLLVRQSAAKGNSKSPQRHLNDFVDFFNSYRDPETGEYPEHILETWNGESVRFYHDLPDYIKSRTKCYGSWQPQRPQSDNQNKEKPKTQVIKKSDILLALVKLVASHAIRIPSIDPNPVMPGGDRPGADLIQQLAIYKEDDGNLPTDRLISLALGAWLATEGRPAQKKVTFIDW